MFFTFHCIVEGATEEVHKFYYLLTNKKTFLFILSVLLCFDVVLWNDSSSYHAIIFSWLKLMFCWIQLIEYFQLNIFLNIEFSFTRLKWNAIKMNRIEIQLIECNKNNWFGATTFNTVIVGPVLVFHSSQTQFIGKNGEVLILVGGWTGKKRSHLVHAFDLVLI